MHWKDIILILSHQKPLVTSLSLIFLCDSCMHEIKVVFLLLFNVSLIIGPAKKPTKEEGKIFLPLQLHGWMFQSAIEGFLTYFWLTFSSAVNNFVETVTDFILGGSKITWRIPGTGEPGGLPSLGSHRVGDD